MASDTQIWCWYSSWDLASGGQEQHWDYICSCYFCFKSSVTFSFMCIRRSAPPLCSLLKHGYAATCSSFCICAVKYWCQSVVFWTSCYWIVFHSFRLFLQFFRILMCKRASLSQPAYAGYFKSVLMIRCANVNLIVTDLSYPEGSLFTWEQRIYKNSSLKRPTYSEGLVL